MFASFEDKGKIFTQVITKEPKDVIIQTTSHQIHGKIHIKPEERLKDELNTSKQFIAVTDAIILNYYGKGTPLRTSFLAININAIVWILPDNELIKDEGKLE